jgi:hypothetical protein
MGETSFVSITHCGFRRNSEKQLYSFVTLAKPRTE